MRTMKTLVSLIVVVAASLGVALGATVEEWPTKPIEIYVGYPPGGPADTAARLYAPIMSKELGVPVMIINKPGAAGATCAEYVAAAKPDGYTLQEGTFGFMVTRPYTIHTTLTFRDFTYILSHSDLNFAFLVRKDAPWKNFQEWVEYARKNPGTKYGTYGAYGITHLAMEWVCRREGSKVLHAPFKGEGDGLPALLGGHIDIFGGAGMHVPLIEAGKLRTLLQLSGEPADTTKVQFLTEIYPDYPEGLRIIMESPSGLAGAKGIPVPIVQKLSKALKKAIDDESFRRFLKQHRRRIVIWESQESLKKLELASEEYGAFLKEIGFVKK